MKEIGIIHHPPSFPSLLPLHGLAYNFHNNPHYQQQHQNDNKVFQ